VSATAHMVTYTPHSQPVFVIIQYLDLCQQLKSVRVLQFCRAGSLLAIANACDLA